MTAAVLARLNAAGIRLEVSGNNRLATPRETLIDRRPIRLRTTP